MIFTQFGRKVAHGKWKKSLDFGGNPDHIVIRLQLGGRHKSYSRSLGILTVTILQDRFDVPNSFTQPKATLRLWQTYALY